MQQLQYACAHKLTIWNDPLRYEWIIRHGENAEAQLVIPERDIIESDDRCYGFNEVLRWLDRVHKYEASTD